MNQVGFNFRQSIDLINRKTFHLDLPGGSIADNTTANITEYPINYADATSPTDGIQELRTFLFKRTIPIRFLFHRGCPYR